MVSVIFRDPLCVGLVQLMRLIKYIYKIGCPLTFQLQALPPLLAPANPHYSYIVLQDNDCQSRPTSHKMKHSTLLLSALAFPHLGSALTCTPNEPECGFPQPNNACNCPKNYPMGSTIDVQCFCTTPFTSGGVQYNTTFYKVDKQDWYIQIDHLTCTGSPAKQCASCVPGQC